MAVTPLPVEISSPTKADIFATYHTTTTIESDTEASIIARVGGEVVEILVEEGDQVFQGQILARLDGDRLRLQTLQAKAKLDKADKEYERFVRLHEMGLASASAYEGLKYDMYALEAAYELQRLDYEYTNIRAPISGVISARDVKVGQHVGVNDATFKITIRAAWSPTCEFRRANSLSFLLATRRKYESTPCPKSHLLRPSHGSVRRSMLAMAHFA